jgi:hypothetical protein
VLENSKKTTLEAFMMHTRIVLTLALAGTAQLEAQSEAN